MPKSDFLKLADGLQNLKDLDWLIYADYLVSDLKARIIECRQKHKIDIVFVDFVQRMRSDKHPKDRVREVEDIAMGLANMARELNVAVIELSQLQGAAEKLESDEVPNMSHFKESQGIPENADSIWTLHSPYRHEAPFSGNEYKPIFFKMRIEQRYDISGATVPLIGDMRNCRFRDATEQELKDVIEKEQNKKNENTKQYTKKAAW